jgi:hypothetical protein
MQKKRPHARRWWFEELEPREPASALGPGITASWLLPLLQMEGPAPADAQATGAETTALAVPWDEVTANPDGAADVPAHVTATSAVATAAPAAQDAPTASDHSTVTQPLAGPSWSWESGLTPDLARPASRALPTAPISTPQTAAALAQAAPALGGAAASTPPAPSPAVGASLARVADQQPPGFGSLLPGTATSSQSARLAPRGGSGPRPGFAQDGCLDLQTPEYVPVNGDDDNGSAVTNGIPVRRDFSVSPLPIPDPELKSATVVNTCPRGGSYQISTPWDGTTGVITLWKDTQKNNRQPLSLTDPPGHSFSFYIEGQRESHQIGDVQLQVTYGWSDPVTQQVTTVTASNSVTVTPVINAFTLTPAGGGGQNMAFTTKGLQAEILPNTPGITFAASVNYTNLPGALTFVQNCTEVDNGYNGTTLGYPSYQPAALTYVLGNDPAGAILAIKDGSLPLLDIKVTATDPDYTFDFVINQADGTTYAIQADDSPYTNTGVYDPKATAVDLRLAFTTWLVWRYLNTVGGQPTLVYYPIAWGNWQAVFYATSSAGPNKGPIDSIIVTRGVTAFADYIRSNATPGTMAATNATGSNRCNDDVVWRFIN